MGGGGSVGYGLGWVHENGPTDNSAGDVTSLLFWGESLICLQRHYLCSNKTANINVKN